jgi:hypothetical protein
VYFSPYVARDMSWVTLPQEGHLAAAGGIGRFSSGEDTRRIWGPSIIDLLLLVTCSTSLSDMGD